MSVSGLITNHYDCWWSNNSAHTITSCTLLLCNKPVGVVICHANVCNYIGWAGEGTSVHKCMLRNHSCYVRDYQGI